MTEQELLRDLRRAKKASRRASGLSWSPAGDSWLSDEMMEGWDAQFLIDPPGATNHWSLALVFNVREGHLVGGFRSLKVAQRAAGQMFRGEREIKIIGVWRP